MEEVANNNDDISSNNHDGSNHSNNNEEERIEYDDYDIVDEDDTDDDEDEDEDEIQDFVEDMFMYVSDGYSNGDPSSSSSSSSGSSGMDQDTGHHITLQNNDNNITIMLDGEQEEKEEEDQEDYHHHMLPAARQHTYLPGTTNPLYPEQWLQNYQYTQQQQEQSEQLSKNEIHTTYHPSSSTITLPILQLDDVVLFPNSTLPLRLTHSSWVKYLSRQIANARDGLIGIGNSEDHGLNNNNITGTGNTHDTDDDHDNKTFDNNSNNNSNNNSSQVRIGIITRLNSGRRHRRRINFGHNRVNDSTNQNNNNDNGGDNDQEAPRDEDHMRNNRMGRWNVQLIRRGIILQRMRNVNNHQDDQDSEDDQDSSDSESSSNDNLRHHGGNLPAHDRYLHPIDPPSDKIDPLINRIGTIATITYTHEEDFSCNDYERDDSVDFRAAENGRQIIVTALSTGRFRIISSASDQSSNEDRSDPRECKMYHVEELIDDSITIPAFISKQSKPFNILDETNNGERNNNNGDCSELPTNDLSSLVASTYHSRTIHYMSKVSHIAGLGYRKVWPWKLIDDIIKEIETNSSLRGLWNTLPLSSGRCPNIINKSCHDNSENERQMYQDNDVNDAMQTKKLKSTTKGYVDPVSFSFWLAANLPLSLMNKLDLLEMNHVERLRYVLDRMIKQRNIISYIKCKHCGSKLAKVNDLFTVHGAEGTSGAYVNEHGIIHQTITVKQIENDCIQYYGGEETRDSWFPGYSWTIAYCRTCMAHLGWKFKQVKKRNFTETSGHNVFWGLSGAAVTTQKSSPRRVYHR